MTSGLLNTVGLLLSLAGVVGLFRYGMPFKVRDGGQIYRTVTQRDEAAAAKEGLYDKLGYLALAFIVCGTGLQIWANYV